MQRHFFEQEPVRIKSKGSSQCSENLSYHLSSQRGASPQMPVFKGVFTGVSKRVARSAPIFRDLSVCGAVPQNGVFSDDPSGHPNEEPYDKYNLLDVFSKGISLESKERK